jgi:F0F1-type ATP synthase membrane subunit b/b'
MCGENKELFFIFLLLLLFLCLVGALRAEEPGLEQALAGLSLAIQSKLQEAKLKSESLSRQLTEARSGLTLSQEQRDRYRETSEKLLSSLDSTIEQCGSLSQSLNQSRQELAAEKERVRARNKILLWTGIIGAAIILGKIAALILYAKRVPMPRWLDIIL